MPIKALKENLKKTILITSCFLFLFTFYLLAADKVDNGKQGELKGLQLQARLYRNGFRVWVI
jgi:hypothetical protein